MAFLRPVVLAIICLSALFIQSGEAIKCYVCNSMNDPNCASIQTHASSYSSSSYLKDCSELVGGAKYTVCRKIDQSVADSTDNSGKTRTIRECGQDDPATETCYQKAGFGGRQYVCSCLKDGCNGAGNLQVALSTLMSITLLAVIGPKFV